MTINQIEACVGDRLAVEVDETPGKTDGGILLPDKTRKFQKPRTGRVVAVGPGKTLDDGRVLPMPVKVGDRVYFGSWAGQEEVVAGKVVWFMRSDDLIAVFD